ncbi:MAG: hypothetical protein ABIR79_06140 [Candidatus Binatia bacterium]
MPCRALPDAVVVFALIALAASPAAAKCDTTANAFALGGARAAIDDACPCAAATSNGAHAKCAKTVVATLVANNQLAKTCKAEALNHAKKSICGRPGAVVCCRVKTSGRTSHKIAGSAAKCTSTSSITACASLLIAVDTGCDAMGCVAPVCGNDVLEPTEECEASSNPVDCDQDCQLYMCDPPTTTCGNGTLEVGETCEPPGVGACGWDCLSTPCASAAPGEIDVACVSGTAAVAVGSRGTDYLMSWSGIAYRGGTDILGRRFDVNGAPFDANAQIVSAGVHCTGSMRSPAVGGNAGRYLLAWSSFEPLTLSSYVYESIYTRPYANDGSLGALDEHEPTYTGFGMCQGFVGGPTTVAPLPAAGSDVLTALWTNGGGCVGLGPFFEPRGKIFDYATDPPATTPATFVPLGQQPIANTGSSMASTATDTLVTWHRAMANGTNPIVGGAWLANDGTSTKFTISTRAPGGSTLRPSVAAASDRFIVAWAQGATTDATEIRGMRVTQVGGLLDPDGGILLATTAGGKVVGPPVAAFDGTVWLVAWSEVGVGGNDLRAVAVQTDGTVLDVTPRLLATGLSGAAPSIASAGDGRSLVMYVKTDGASGAVRAQLVPTM